MSQPIDQLITALQQQGRSLTRPRRLIFRALAAKEPQTMAQIMAACRQVDRASVYRTIALFEKLGIVQRLPIGWKYQLELSDSFRPHHHHFSCRRCGAVTALAEDPALERRLAVQSRRLGLKMQSHQLEIEGVCQKCTSQANG